MSATIVNIDGGEVASLKSHQTATMAINGESQKAIDPIPSPPHLFYPNLKLQTEFKSKNNLLVIGALLISAANIWWVLFIGLTISETIVDNGFLFDWRFFSLLVPCVCVLTNICFLVAFCGGYIRVIEITFIVNIASLLMHIPMVIALQPVFYFVTIDAAFQAIVLFFNYRAFQRGSTVEESNVSWLVGIRKCYVSRANTTPFCVCTSLRKTSIAVGVFKLLVSVAFLVLICVAPSINYIVLIAGYLSFIIDCIGLYGICVGNAEYVLSMVLTLVAIAILWISPLIAEQSIVNSVNAAVVIIVQSMLAYVFWRCYALIREVQSKDWAVAVVSDEYDW